jgi:predicted CoA-substrate-specific enzyme activase
MPASLLHQIQPAPKEDSPAPALFSASPPQAPHCTGKICSIDVGSTTCKYVLASAEGKVLAQAYERHNTKQAEKVLEFLERLENEHNLAPRKDRVFLTGSGCGMVAPLIGGKIVQEVVAVAAAVEQLHPEVRFVSEIGGEDMKTIFFTGAGARKNKQVLMQSACSGGTGTFIEKTARKLEIPTEQLAGMGYTGHTLHKISSKCGIFSEADANNLLKAGVPVQEIVASLFEAVVFQNLSTLTRGNTPLPQVLLLGGPNLFFSGLQQAWRYHLLKLWKERNSLPLADPSSDDASSDDSASLVVVPEGALYYAALGCIAIASRESADVGIYRGTAKLRWWISEGQHEEKKKEGRTGLWTSPEELESFQRRYGKNRSTGANGSGHADASQTEIQAVSARPAPAGNERESIVVGCDFGSTTAKAVCLGEDKEILFSCYALSKGNPIEDAKVLFRQVRDAMKISKVSALAITGYGKDLLKDVLGADCAVVETIAHATAGLHFFPDADCICDVGGVDVKIMMLNQGAVTDFRLNSQCSSGNGAFLQGVAERFGIPLDDIAEAAFRARSTPRLSMGCGVFLQSDIVNQQRKGWHADEILAALCAVLPLNVWIYAGGLNNMRQVGRKYILQGGTHKNLAVVKTQLDFINSKVKDAEVIVHPYPGESGAIGAALVALDWRNAGGQSRFRGFHAVEQLTYRATTSKDTVCHWCPVNCQRTFIDVELEGAKGRAWSNVPVPAGWERVIVNNSCAKGLVENANEMKLVKAEMERIKHAFPNVAEMVRKEGFRRNAVLGSGT